MTKTEPQKPKKVTFEEEKKTDKPISKAPKKSPKLSKKKQNKVPDTGMSRFQKHVKKASDAARESRSSNLRIVLGNTSCDLDSVVGSLILSYYYTEKLGKLYTPVINCPRGEFFCKLEITTHLTNCGIKWQDFFFFEELKEFY